MSKTKYCQNCKHAPICKYFNFVIENIQFYNVGASGYLYAFAEVCKRYEIIEVKE